jgi:transposase
MTMVTIGSDPHKSSHTFVAVDGNGRKLAEKTVKAVSEGHLEALRWARQWPERVWALENSRHLVRRLERDLLVAGEAAVRVPSRLMAENRKQGRQRSKSDPIDALAVARAALREPGLPVAQLEGVGREVRLLVDHREDLVGDRSQMQNRLRWHLHELEPGYRVPAGALSRVATLNRLGVLLAGRSGTVAELARELLGRVRELTVRIDQLESQLGQLVTPLASSLLALQGCGVLTAAKIIGEVGNISRFRSKAAFARYNGSAPIPVWSGNDDHHRLNPGGNRQLNAALHRIAITQARSGGLGRAYLDHRLQERDTKKEAMRALKRRLSDEVYGRLLADERTRMSDKETPDAQAA